LEELEHRALDSVRAFNTAVTYFLLNIQMRLLPRDDLKNLLRPFTQEDREVAELDDFSKHAQRLRALETMMITLMIITAYQLVRAISS
jgi:hypothetical protein